MKLTLFTVEEANRTANEIRPMVERVVEAKQELDGLQARIDVLSLVAAGASSGNPDAEALAQVTERRKELAGELRHRVQLIQKHGCVVKDLERGLVDFYSVSGDRLIFQCWQLGENEVSHWHSLEGGYSNRQPLDRSELE